MKIVVWAMIPFMFAGCTELKAKKKSLNADQEQISCENKAAFGDMQFCLPDIDGMTECYDLPLVKSLADQFEADGNSVLAFYLNDSTYKHVDSLDKIVYDDYFKIYVTNSLQNIRQDIADLDEMVQMIKGNYLQENWNELKQKTESKMDFLSVDVPVIVESYTPHEQVRTIIMLIKYVVGESEVVIVATMNMILLHDRLIWLAYYKHYDGEASIKNAKSKNDYIALRLMSENK